MEYNAIVYIADPDTRYGVLGFADKILGKEFTAGGIVTSKGNGEKDYYPYHYVNLSQVLYYIDGGIGYGSIISGNDFTDDEMLEELETQTNDYNKNRGEKYWSDREMINCGTNKRLFKLIMQMNDSVDINTPFVDCCNPNKPNIFINRQWEDFEKDCTNPEWKKRIRKATIEDLIELTKLLI